MEQHQKDFLSSEYSALRQEVLDTLEEVPKNERLALVLSAVLWAWFVVNAGEFPILFYISWLPFALTYLLYFRWRALDRKFDEFHDYFLRIEDEFDLSGLGCEHFIDNRRSEWFKGSARPFWCFLIAGNAGLAIAAIAMHACGIAFKA